MEIAAYDPLTHRVFVTFAEQARVEGIDISDPANPVLALTIDLGPSGGGDAHATSVAVRDGVLAVAMPQGVDDTAPGKVLFFSTDGVFLSAVTVGALPDMLTFTPDGLSVLSANEGQPTNDYSYDPEGSVSIIDISGGVASLTDADVTTVGFAAFNDATLDPSIRIFGPGASVAQDLEPEYVAVSHDSKTAWVTLQENNAFGIIDLKQKTVTKLVGLGFKDHSQAGQGLDGGRDDGGNKIKTWPVLGMYLPDAIATLFSKGRTYLVTANEGDVREYAGLNTAGTEAVEIEDIPLDPTAFPNAATLQSRPLGIARLKVTSFGGDTDGDGDYDRLLSYGARSFSIWSEDGELVFDSGDALEQRTAAAYPTRFNASSTNNTRDDRSDDKGPEPEGVVIAKLFGRHYVFIMLERIGGVMVYDVTEPEAPELVQYINTRDFGAAPNTAAAGDLGAEGARVIDEDASPTGKPLLVVSNEVSGTLRVFEIQKVK
ncbi:MAG TPA: choice-of-anchor I family protein [Vicinamibacterales bacterium]|nr:choice-of-anchor I family protein [Vicinamibacterales bacterium]